jgi:peptide chain release factor 2
MSAKAGVHRLVRISPFDQQARRHTAFASVYVWPEIEDDVELEIPEKDLRIDTYRSSGAGGQHVNVTDSAVRITHLPTGIVVSCQNERSQHKNRDVAMKVLRARLYDLRLKEQQAKLEQFGGTKKDIAFGSQIRSYVLQPYQMVKDHRTKQQVGDVHRVLDGDLDQGLPDGQGRRHAGPGGVRRGRVVPGSDPILAGARLRIVAGRYPQPACSIARRRSRLRHATDASSSGRSQRCEALSSGA